METYASADIDRVRTTNQDYIYSSPEKVGSLPNLFLAADSIGGYRVNDYASWFAVENLVIYINRTEDGSLVIRLKKGTETVNGVLYEKSLKRKELRGMERTLVVDVVEDNTLRVASAEDSRLYSIHGDSIRQVTRNHSCVEGMVAIGQMKGGSEDYNRRKSIVTRTLGTGGEMEPDFFEVDLEGEGYILLCSDSFSNMLKDWSMHEIITGEGGLKEKAALLIKEANRRGGIDNIAVALISPSEGETDVRQLPEHISRTGIRFRNGLAQAACR